MKCAVDTREASDSLASLDLISTRSSGDVEASLGQVQLAAVGQSLVALFSRLLQTLHTALHPRSPLEY